jgi:uncharacterized membrane protein YciS (DUF1049 family)
MKKEYSDLSKAHKSIFALQMIIDLAFMIGSLIVFMVAVLIAAKGIPYGIIQTDFFSFLILAGVGFSVIAGMVFSYIIKAHMKLYTPLDLQKYERKVKTMKEALKDK